MKRTLALILCAVMVGALAAGCGKAPEADNSASGDKAAATVETKATEAPKEGDAKTAEPAAPAEGGDIVTAPGEFPIVKEKANYTCVVAVGPFVEDMATNEFSKWYEEKTNVHIEYNTIPEQGANEKVAVLLAGADLPDFFMNASVPDMAVKYGIQEKMIIPVNDLIDKHAKHLKETLSEDLLSYTRQLDGNIYGLPTYSDCFHCSMAAKMWINTKWLDKLGLKMPTTTEEFAEVLRAFKTKDPNGNGKADEIPLVGATRGWHATVDKFLMSSFLYYDLSINPEEDLGTNYGGWFVTDDKKIDTALNKDGFKEGMKYLAGLYKEGLIYDGSFTQDDAQLVQIVENPDAEIVGCVPGGWGGIFSKVPGERYNSFMPISPLKGPTGEQNAITFPQAPSTSLWITNKCKNPEVIVRWADWFYSEEGTLVLRRGFEGKDWRWPTEGEIGINGKPAVWTQLVPWNDSEPQNVRWTRLGVFNESDALRLGQTTDTSLDRHSMDGLELLLYEETKSKYEPYARYNRALPPLKFTDEQMSELSTLKVEYAKYVRQWVVEFITGKKNIDTDWDTYVKGLDGMGLNSILEYYNESYKLLYGN